MLLVGKSDLAIKRSLYEKLPKTGFEKQCAKSIAKRHCRQCAPARRARLAAIGRMDTEFARAVLGAHESHGWSQRCPWLTCRDILSFCKVTCLLHGRVGQIKPAAPKLLWITRAVMNARR